MSAETPVCRCGTPLRWNLMAQRHMEACKCPPLSPAAEAEFRALRAQLDAVTAERDEAVLSLAHERRVGRTGYHDSWKRSMQREVSLLFTARHHLAWQQARQVRACACWRCGGGGDVCRRAALAGKGER